MDELRDRFKKVFGEDLFHYLYFDSRKFLNKMGIKPMEVPYYALENLLKESLGEEGYKVFHEALVINDKPERMKE